MSSNFGFLRAGKMATALAAGLVRSGRASAAQIAASDPNPRAMESFVAESGGAAMTTNAEVASACDVLVLAVKPQHAEECLRAVAPTLSNRHLLVSIVAGTRLATIKECVQSRCRVARAMPNTPCLIGEGATAICPGPLCAPEDMIATRNLFEAVGVVVQTTEPQLDAVTGLSGSGPAYVFVFLEALADAGVAAGLPRDVATKLATQTVLGAAAMAKQTGLPCATLKEQVMSPAGTTAAGLAALERLAFRGATWEAVLAATRRAAELGGTGPTN